MKVIAFNGSARRDGNTAMLVRAVFAELECEEIETELVQLSGEYLPGCAACYKCAANKNHRCAVEGDIINESIAKMEEADGIILASPTYVADVSPGIKALIERATIVARGNGHIFERKVGAAVVAVRRAGALHAIDTLNHFFAVNQMFICGSSYWNLAVGRNIGEVEQDSEGMQTMRDLGRNMAWLLKRIATC